MGLKFTGLDDQLTTQRTIKQFLNLGNRWIFRIWSTRFLGKPAQVFTYSCFRVRTKDL